MLTILLAILFLLCAFYLTIYLYHSYKNKNLYDAIYEDLKIDKSTEELVNINSNFSEKVKELQKKNSDIKGWIRIENTNINYPLLQTTDNNFYLTHNFKKETNSYGSIFINSNCNMQDNNANLIIYGHYTENGQMFHNLHNYIDKKYYEQHPIIQIITTESKEEYEIIYAFKSRIFCKDETDVFKYYHYYNFKNKRQYNEYIDNCKTIQLYDTGKTAIYGEKLITLITCDYSQKNGRMVIVAKKK